MNHALTMVITFSGLYITNFVRSSNALGFAILNDTDVNPTSPTNPSYNLELREIITKPDGALSTIVKYKTHFYIVKEV